MDSGRPDPQIHRWIRRKKPVLDGSVKEADGGTLCRPGFEKEFYSRTPGR